MRNSLSFFLLALLLISFYNASSFGSPSIRFKENEEKVAYSPNEILIKFKQNVEQDKIAAAYSLFNVEEVKNVGQGEVRRIKIPSNISVEEAISSFEQNPDVEYAEPNYIIKFYASSNDTEFDQLWGLNNIGQDINGTIGTPDADIDAPEAWDINTGSSNVIIAILDTGVAYTHPEISPNIWVNSAENLGQSGFDDDGNGYVDDIYGWDFWANDADPEDYSPVSHGTHIAGTIAASGNNNDGITGINWNASIMALRIGGIIGVISDASEAIYYAVDNGATIINASWGSENFSQTLYDAIQYADNNGVLFIAAAGNEGADNDIKKIYPSNYDIENIISVSATDQDDKIAEFSNYGPTTVDIAAPGVNIYSTSIDLGLASKTVAYSENFDPQPSGWKAGGNNNSWSFATNTGRSNSGCLEDSPGTNYKNNVESFVFNENSINILKDNLYTFSFWLKNELEADNDRLFFIVSTNGSDFVLNDDYWTGNSGGYFNRHEISFLPELVAEFYFGFFMTSDSSGTYDGVYIDDIEVYRQELIIDDFDFEHKDGTSMAAPHISGVAGLIKAQNPDYSHYEIRDAILYTVEKKPSLSGKIISEGRVNAFNAVTYLAAPKDLKAEPGDKIVILSWDANVEEACSGYKIYYVESSSESDANTLDAGTETYNGAEEACRGCKIYETVSARAVEGTEINVGDQTYYEVSGLTNGVAYDFYVWATGNFDGLGNIEAPYSTYVSATPFSLETQGNNIPSPEVGEEGGGGGCFISNIRCSF